MIIFNLLSYFLHLSLSPQRNEPYSCSEVIVSDKSNTEIFVRTDFYFSTTKCNGTVYALKDINDLNNCSDFVTNDKTIILIHGYNRNYKEKWIQRLNSILTKNDETNIIMIDWKVDRFYDKQKIPDLVMYNTDVYHLEVVSGNISSMLQNLAEHNIKWKNLQIIGHSLGAHVAGQTAEKLKGILTVNRLTGLDPAGPCFEIKNNKTILNKNQADFVDVIHTDCDRNKGNLGLFRPVGNIDFYPNGGKLQPGCPKIKKSFFSFLYIKILKIISLLVIGEDAANLVLNIVWSKNALVCNHYRAPDYYILSIIDTDCKYLSVPYDRMNELKMENVSQVCKYNECVEMGVNAILYKNKPGRYYINMDDVNKNCSK